MKASDKKLLIENMKRYWPEAKLGRTSLDDLIWLVDIIKYLNESGGKRSMSETLAKYRAKYQSCTSASGRTSLNNGDDVAQFLDGMTNTEVLQAAERILGFDDGELQERYAHLNIGAQRMNGGNLLRGAIKRQDIKPTDLY